MQTIVNEMFNIEKQVVFVTGGNGQIGLSLVLSLIKAKAKVIAVDLELNNLKELINLNNWTHNQIQILKCDIRKEDEVKLVFNKASEKFGEITSLVANAGVAVFENYLDRKESSIDMVMDVNIKGSFFCIREYIKHRKTYKTSGKIVIVGSHYGLVSPDPRIYSDTNRASSEIYGASKAGLIQMAKYFAVHAADYNIRTNAVSPGGIYDNDNSLSEEPLQEITQGEGFRKHYNYRCPMKRMATTDEVIGPILFLLSPASSYINGHNIVIDGGFTAW